jgi:DNA-directed RNA polymerase subunit RPC12/RpoP
MADIYRCRACGSSNPLAGIDPTTCPVCQVSPAEFSITCGGCKKVSKGPEIGSPGYCPNCGDRYLFLVVASSPASPSSKAAALPPAAASEERPASSQQAQAAPPEAATAAAEIDSGSSLLIRLKQQAAEKLASEAKQTGLQQQQKAALSKALSNAYSYLCDFTKQVNVLKPEYPGAYILSDLAKFDALTWKEGFTDYRLVPGATDDRLLERVTLSYSLTGKDPIIVEREPPRIELFARSLHENGLAADVTEFKNNLGRVARTRFAIKREVRASLLLVGDYATGDMRLRIVNVQRLGSEDYRIPADELTQSALEEVALLVLGASKKFVQRFKRVI